LIVTAVGRDAVKSECDATVSVPTEKTVYSGADSAAVLSVASQQNAASAPPVKRPRYALNVYSIIELINALWRRHKI